MNELRPTDFDRIEVSGRIFELLRRQCEKFCGVDSTSVSAERAESLLSSLLYTLNLVAETEGKPLDEIVLSDAEENIRRGQMILDRKRRDLCGVYADIMNSAPQIGNIYYLSTMAEIGRFFARYEIYYAAHEIPCSIDYVLLRPIDESRLGISFIEQYLFRIAVENRILSFFDTKEISVLQRENVADSDDLPLNLCEPVFVNAIGRILSENDLKSVKMTDKDRKKIAKLLQNSTERSLENRLVSAAEELRRALDLSDRGYLTAAALDLAPRFTNALENHCIDRLFL